MRSLCDQFLSLMPGSQRLTRSPPSSVGGVHCVDVAVELVSKRHPSLGGEIYLRAPAQASCSFAVAAPGCCGVKAGLRLLNGN